MSSSTDPTYDELLEAMPQIAEAVNRFDSDETKREALVALLGAQRGQHSVVVAEQGEASTPRGQDPSPTKKTQAKSTRTGTSKNAVKKTGPSLLGDLNLKEKGRESFGTFVIEKAPRSMQEKSVVAVYYLQHELKLTDINADHVYSCFRDQSWRVPTDMANHLQVLSSTKKWIDTSKMEAISVTTIGENFVLHDLPKSPSS